MKFLKYIDKSDKRWYNNDVNEYQYLMDKLTLLSYGIRYCRRGLLC